MLGTWRESEENLEENLRRTVKRLEASRESFELQTVLLVEKFNIADRNADRILEKKKINTRLAPFQLTHWQVLFHPLEAPVLADRKESAP